MRTCIRGAKIITAEGILEKRDLVFDDKILSVVPYGYGEGNVVYHRGYLSAGFIELSIYGAAGVDTMQASPDTFRKMAKALPQSGVTAFLATTTSDTTEKMCEVLRASKEFRKTQTGGAELLGIHLEGPFLNPAYGGAHDPAFLRDASEEWSEEEKREIRIITLAPERDPEYTYIKKWSSEGMVVSLGHSAITYEEAMKAWRKGAVHIAHCFHDMPSFHHRNPGLLGAAMALPFTVELISDGVHIHPILFDVVAKVKGYEKIILVSNATAGLFCPDGIYPLGNQKIKVENRVCTLENGRIVGSVHRLDQALITMAQETNIPINKIIAMLTINPAKRLRIDHRKGTLEEGKDADVVLLDENFQLEAVYVAGRQTYRRGEEND